MNNKLPIDKRSRISDAVNALVRRPPRITSRRPSIHVLPFSQRIIPSNPLVPPSNLDGSHLLTIDHFYPVTTRVPFHQGGTIHSLNGLFRSDRDSLVHSSPTVTTQGVSTSQGTSTSQRASSLQRASTSQEETTEGLDYVDNLKSRENRLTTRGSGSPDQKTLSSQNCLNVSPNLI